MNKNIYYKQSNQLGAIMKRVKNRLLDIRLDRRIKTQTEFADILGFNRQDYNRIENNKKQIGLLVALELADKLNLKVDDIFYLDKCEDKNENED
jgi:putative transcriptional regulator